MSNKKDKYQKKVKPPPPKPVPPPMQEVSDFGEDFEKDVAETVVENK